MSASKSPGVHPVDVTPLELTRQVRDISVTERNDFKGCHRRWYLGTILNLEPKGVRNWAFDFGTGIHAGLENYYIALHELRTSFGVNKLGEGWPMRRALEGFDEWYEALDTEIRQAQLGAFESEVRNELLTYKTLGHGMLENYFDFAKNEDDFTVCAVEGLWTKEGLELLKEHGGTPPYGRLARPLLHPSGRYLVPIVDPVRHSRLRGTPFLSARLDMVIYRTTPGLKGFWVVDHKSSGSSPSDRGMDMDDQVTGYSYTFWRVTGVIPRGTIFNYLIKQVPKPPRLVRDDTALSTAKDQLTTAKQYRQALVEFELIDKSGRISSDKHAECYEALLARGFDSFFRRFDLQRNEHELMMFEKRLPEEYRGMKDAAKDPGTRAIPHLSQYNCPGCPVAPICQAIEDGSDYEDVIANRFQQAEDRKAK